MTSIQNEKQNLNVCARSLCSFSSPCNIFNEEDSLLSNMVLQLLASILRLQPSLGFVVRNPCQNKKLTLEAQLLILVYAQVMAIALLYEYC